MTTTHNVQLSRAVQPPGADAAAMAAPCLSRPEVWLGAPCPFGLSLPDATPTAATMYAPRGVWLDDQRLVVCDSGNHRLLIWNHVPTADHTPADVVLCQPAFDSEGPNAAGRGAANGVHLPTGVLVHDGRLVVADAWNHRVLVWNRVPTSSGTPPDYAIGQAGLDQTEVNRGGPASLATMNWPYGVGCFDGRLYVADTGNRRLLVWEEFPDHDRPADLVIGQASADRGEENRGGPVAADSFRWPHDFACVDGRLFVADAGNHRVVGWPNHPAADGPAGSVLGQKDFASAYELPYDAQGPQRLRFPYAVDSDAGVLAAADTANNRVLFWRTPLDRAVDAPAIDVLGQPDFAANGENRWLSVARDTLCWPYGMRLHNGRLAIADSGNNRVILWDVSGVIQLASGA